MVGHHDAVQAKLSALVVENHARLILGSLIAFALLSQLVNMITGIVALVFLSAFAGTSYSIRRNALVAISLVGIAFLFREGLGLQLPLY